MCINCNIRSPLADWLADILKLERRKYLVIGHTTHKYIDDNTELPYSLDILNYRTIGSFEFVGSVTPIRREDGIILYEGKYKQTNPIDKKDIRDETAYRELFIGDLEFS